MMMREEDEREREEIDNIIRSECILINWSKLLIKSVNLTNLVIE